VKALWPDERPANPAKALQVLVSHARAQLGIIAGTPTGYRLGLRQDEVDAAAVLVRAAASARHARVGDHVVALEHAEAGLALWDVPAEPRTSSLSSRCPRWVWRGGRPTGRWCATARWPCRGWVAGGGAPADGCQPAQRPMWSFG
jgi:hypothetical protein